VVTGNEKGVSKLVTGKEYGVQKMVTEIKRGSQIWLRKEIGGLKNGYGRQFYFSKISAAP
jgi:hypothetical protein